MPYLPFKANGHLFCVADGEQIYVSTSTPGEPFAPNLITARCGVCNEGADLQFTDDAVLVQTPCAYPDGVTSVITLAVPSGRIIVSDDLRPVYDWPEDGLASYNSALGQKQAVEAMANAGCAYGPVGNSCPGLYRTGEDTYIIASAGLDEDDNPLLPETDCVAGIITDLWAYSIADYEDWKRRIGIPAALGWTQTIVDVIPGTYEFTHHTGERGFDRDAEGTVIFAHIRRIS